MHLLAVDTETTGLNPWGSIERWGFEPARPFAVSMCDKNGENGYIRRKVNPLTRRVDWPGHPTLIWDLHRTNVRKIFFNAPFDLRMLQFAGVPVTQPYDDVLVMMHVLTGGAEPRYALKPLAKKFLGYPDDDETDLQKATVHARHEAKKKGWCIATEEHFGREPVKADYWLAPDAICRKYALADAERTMLLYLMMREELSKSPALQKMYEQEMALQPILFRMEAHGLWLLTSQVDRLIDFYNKYAKEQRTVCDREGGKGLNVNSPKQMVAEFYTRRKYPQKLTENGNPSLDSAALRKIAQKHGDRLAKAILEHNAATHALKSFLLPYQRFQVDGVLHPNFRQCGPVTGRMSSTNPNLMNVAGEDAQKKNDTDIAYRQREVFGPRPGHVWYLPDYSQIEVWLFAFLSGDKQMQDMLLSGHDFHGQIARLAWGNQPDFEANFKAYRKRGKIIFFCKQYGGGVRAVAKQLECSEAEAREFSYAFDDRLPGVRKFMDQIITRVQRDGVVSNPFGRAYYVDPNYAYKATNYLIQGSGADILKRTMIRLDSLFRRRWPGTQLLLPLHDELIIEVPRRYHSKRLMREIIVEMQRDSHIVNVPRPLPVGMKIATRTWAKTTPVEL